MNATKIMQVVLKSVRENNSIYKAAYSVRPKDKR